MADFPQNAVIFDTDPTWTADMARPEFEKWLDATLQLPGAREPEPLTIATGQIAPTRAMVIVDTEGQAAADDLAAISTSGLHAGAVLLLRAADESRVVTVKHGTGTAGIELEGAHDIVLPATSWLMLRRDGERWVQMLTASAAGGWELSPGAESYMRQDAEVTYSGMSTDPGYGDVDAFGYGYDHRSGNWDGLMDGKFVAAFRLEAYGAVTVSLDVSTNDGGFPGNVRAAIFLNGTLEHDLAATMPASTGYHTYTRNISGLKPGDVIAVKITNGPATQTTKAKNVRILIADLGA